MSKHARPQVRLSALVLSSLPVLAGLTACDDSPTGGFGYVDVPAPVDRDDALGRLSADEQAKLEAWQTKLVKGCSVDDAVRGERQPDSSDVIDVTVLEGRLEQGRMLRADGRFALLDVGAPDEGRYGTNVESSSRSVRIGGKEKQAKRTISTLRQGEACVLSVDGFELARATVRDAIDVRAFHDGARKAETTDVFAVTGDETTATVDPAVFLETANLALEVGSEGRTWVAAQLQVDDASLFTAEGGPDSQRVIADEPSTWMFAGRPERSPSFFSSTPDAFVTAQAVSVESRFALWSADGGLTVSVALDVARQGEARPMGRGYELTAEAKALGAVSLAKVTPAAVGSCVSELLARPLSAFGPHRGAFHLSEDDVFASCAGFALDAQREALRSDEGGAALASWLSDANMATMYGMYGWDTSLSVWLGLSLTDDAAHAALTNHHEGSLLLTRLSSAVDVVRAELPGRSSAEAQQLLLPDVLATNLIEAHFGQEAALDVAALVDHGDALYRLDPALLRHYLNAVLHDVDEAKRADACVARVTAEQRARIVALRTKQIELADLEEWGLDFTNDTPVSRWVFDVNGCTEAGLVRLESALAAAIDFVAEERERGLSYDGESDVAQVVGFGLFRDFTATQYMQLESLATFFRKDIFCTNAGAASEAIVCSLGDLSPLEQLLDARYEGRYAVLAPEFAAHLDALKAHPLEQSDLQTKFVLPVWGQCSAAAFAEKRAALKDAVTDLARGGLGTSSDAFYTALVDCDP